jgi:hypothetical protein
MKSLAMLAKTGTQDELEDRLFAIVSNAELAERHFHEIGRDLRVFAMILHPDTFDKLVAGDVVADPLKRFVVQVCSRSQAAEVAAFARGACSEVAAHMRWGAREKRDHEQQQN